MKKIKKEKLEMLEDIAREQKCYIEALFTLRLMLYNLKDMKKQLNKKIKRYEEEFGN
jgi:hypothetical protein